ncbi:unnamed protein product [Staurois parvus]|uniref:Uncharacterized protein n=1 Tax=Staurois parvus TaxID=386267 RepID=A0ABN9EMS2_9NEOB|nr:unnamed protein product [Staurois parvus]
MVGVTSQGSSRRSQQRSGSGRVSNENRNRNAGNKIQGLMEKTHTKAQTAVWPSLKYTSVNQLQVFG